MESREWVAVRVRPHHLWAFLVDHFLSTEALPHDLIVRLAHDLSRDQTTAHNHKFYFKLTFQQAVARLWLCVAHLNEVSVEQIVVLVKKTCGRETKTNGALLVISTTFISKLYESLFVRQI